MRSMSHVLGDSAFFSLSLRMAVRAQTGTFCAFYSFCAVAWCGDSRLGKVAGSDQDTPARSKSSSSYSLLLHSTHLKGLFESLLLLPGERNPLCCEGSCRSPSESLRGGCTQPPHAAIAQK